jgi:hypothetical protein
MPWSLFGGSVSGTIIKNIVWLRKLFKPTLIRFSLEHGTNMP